MKVKSVNKKQSVIEYDASELENKLMDFVLFNKVPVKTASTQLGIPHSKVRAAYISILSTMYGDKAESIVDSNF